MFKERYNRIVLPFFFILDIILVIIISDINNYYFENFPAKVIHYLFIIFSWAIPSIKFKSYRVPRKNSFLLALRPTFFTFCIFSLFYIFSILIAFFPKSVLENHVIFLFSIFISQHVISLARYNFFLQYRRKGKNIRQAILVGNLSSIRIKELKADATHFGYHFISIIPDSSQYIEKLTSISNKKRIDVIFLIESNTILIEKVIAFCDDYGIRLKLILALSKDATRRIGLDTIGNLPVMDIRHEPLLYLGNRLSKRIVDIILSVLSIIFILIWLPIVVKIFQILTYPGPLFFKQDRIGQDGKIFRLYKFRTMRVSSNNINAEKGQSEKTKVDDSRVPFFGSLLRRTNLDEYPQFLNVLFGSMSAVGPRPHMVGEDNMLEKNVKKYRVRRFVKPGITGWAAINGLRGGTEDMKLMKKRTDYDIWYLENWTLWLDIKIILITIWQMITFRIPKAY